MSEKKTNKETKEAKESKDLVKVVLDGLDKKVSTKELKKGNISIIVDKKRQGYLRKRRYGASFKKFPEKKLVKLTSEADAKKLVDKINNSVAK